MIFAPTDSSVVVDVPSHLDNIGQQMGFMLNSKLGIAVSDVTFLVGVAGVQIKAHRLALVLASEPFQQLFSSGMLESQTCVVRLPHSTVAGFRLLLQFVYTGSLPEDCFVRVLSHRRQ